MGFQYTSTNKVYDLAAGLGFEPRSPVSETGVTAIRLSRIVLSEADQSSEVFYLIFLPESNCVESGFWPEAKLN